MDSAMDSLSTTSERSNASSSIGGSPNNNNNNINNNNNNNSVVKSSMSPLMPINHSNRDNMNNNHNNTSGQRTTSNSSSLHNNTHDNHLRNSSISPLHHSRSPRSSPLDCGPGVGNVPQQLHALHHSISPPHVSTPNNLSVMAPRMGQGLQHLPPHGIGLLNSLQMIHHGSPLELMAAAHHQMPPRTYNSPPPISSSDPTANECKLVEYRGQKVAAFIIGGDTMLCLPQAFELFLKHLVGGLHTVYTKLKRLDIVPLVCNVEQVRILRGLGAIQPGVNRCKLLACKDFDILYRDCTTARCLSVKPPESSRPGRPPKRGPVGLSLSSSHMSHHPHLKKHRLDNGDYPYENGHLNDDDLIVRKRGRPCNSWRRTVDAEMEQIEISRLDKSPLLANGYNAPPTHLNPLQYMQMSHHPNAANLMNSSISAHNLGRPDGSGVMGVVKPGQTGIPSVEAIARSGIWENCRAAYEDIVKHLERLRDEKVDERGIVRDHKLRDLSSQNGSSSNGHSPILNLSKSGIDHSVGEPSDHSEEDHRSPVPTLHEDDDNLSDHNDSDNDDREDKDDNSDYSEVDCEIPPVSSISSAPGSAAEQHHQALNYTSMAMQQATNQQEVEQNLSSTETLLRNIQNLIKVATENARQQERQTSYEKAELKMDVLREREVKDSLERQLNDERRLRVLYQKRFKREKKVRSRIQQQLELEIKRRAQLEDVLKSSANVGGTGGGGGTGGVNPVALENLSRAGNDLIENSDRPSSVSDKIKPEPNSYSNTNCDTQTSVQSQSQSQQSQHQAAERREREASRNERDVNRETNASTIHPQQTSSASSTSSTTTPTTQNDGKPWNYPNIDLMATGAFWHNYSDSIAHEIEMERKVRQQSGESDIKSPMQDRPNYYKNSVLFTSAT